MEQKTPLEAARARFQKVLQPADAIASIRDWRELLAPGRLHRLVHVLQGQKIAIFCYDLGFVAKCISAAFPGATKRRIWHEWEISHESPHRRNTIISVFIMHSNTAGRRFDAVWLLGKGACDPSAFRYGPSYWDPIAISERDGQLGAIVDEPPQHAG